MKRLIPREHGGWVMLGLPFLTGMFSGSLTGYHLPLFLAWLFFYLASYAFRQAIPQRRDRRMWIKWGIGFIIVGLLFVGPPLLWEPTFLGLAPLFLLLFSVNMGYAFRRNERAFFNDLCAVIAFSLGGVAAYVTGTGKWDEIAFSLFFHCVIYFTGTIFFVKSVIRERGNPQWLRMAKAYHLSTPALTVVLGQPWMALPLGYPLWRIFRYGGKPIRPITAGKVEGIGALQFLFLSVAIMKWVYGAG